MWRVPILATSFTRSLAAATVRLPPAAAPTPKQAMGQPQCPSPTRSARRASETCTAAAAAVADRHANERRFVRRALIGDHRQKVSTIERNVVFLLPHARTTSTPQDNPLMYVLQPTDYINHHPASGAAIKHSEKKRPFLGVGWPLCVRPNRICCRRDKRNCGLICLSIAAAPYSCILTRK